LPLRDLKTRRLPSDTPQLTEFLDQVEGKTTGIDYTRDPNTGLLTGVLDTRFYNAQNFKSKISYNHVDEKSFGSFRYTWPDANVVDKRDEMHKRGWTYFRISGQINGKKVKGWGQIPFVYDTYKERKPWLRLFIDDEGLEIVDSPSQAYITKDEKLIASYPAGTFFEGLARQWSGIHTIDVIRRDAAEKKIKFSFRNFDNDNSHYGWAEITLPDQTDPCQIQAAYTVDIDNDLLQKIEFPANGNSPNRKKGILEFEYLEDIEQFSKEFIEPSNIKTQENKHKNSMGTLWLIELAQGTLAQ
jgi:hypothetical protein